MSYLVEVKLKKRFSKWTNFNRVLQVLLKKKADLEELIFGVRNFLLDKLYVHADQKRVLRQFLF